MAGSAKKRKRRQARKRRAPGAAPADPQAPAAAPPAAKPRRSRRGPEPPPPAPWGSFPLVELLTLVAIVMVIGGLVVVQGERRGVMVGVGLLLGSLAGLEVAVREHFAGYRSHTLLLAAVPAIMVIGVLFFTKVGLPVPVRIGTGGVIFALSAWGLTNLFRNRSGGYSFRIAKPR